MNKMEIANRIEEICREFDKRVELIGLSNARKEIATALDKTQRAVEGKAPAIKEAGALPNQGFNSDQASSGICNWGQTCVYPGRKDCIGCEHSL